MPLRLAGLLPKSPWPRPGRLGVDIGSAAVKLLRWPGDSAAPPDYAIQPLPPGAVVNRSIRDVDAVGRVIAKAASTLRPGGGDVVTAVPASAVMQHSLEMETRLPDAELDALVQLEAERHVPWPLAEVRIDFCRLGYEGSGAGRVLLTVCRREHVDAREQALIRAGLRPEVVDVEHHAMERALVQLTEDIEEGPIAIADIGACAICLHVLAAGRSVHCEERPFSGSEPLRREPASYAQAVVRQLAQALQVFHSSSHHGRVARLFLGGAGALAEGLAAEARQALGLPVECANPFPAHAGERFANDGPALLLAAGLAAPGVGHDRIPAR